MIRVERGQLWSEVRYVDWSHDRTVRWFVIVAVSGDQVATVDVDHEVWSWRPALRSWGVGDVPQTELTGQRGMTTVADLDHRHFVLMADPQHVGCVVPAAPPMQISLLNLLGGEV